MSTDKSDLRIEHIEGGQVPLHDVRIDNGKTSSDHAGPSQHDHARVVRTKDMANSRLADVLLKEPPNPWAPHMFKLYGVLFISYLCSATNGFDANTFGGLLATNTFLQYFSIDAGSEGLIAAMYVIGNIAGSFIAAQTTDRFGRRFGMAVGSIICIVGAILQSTAHDLGMLKGGRFILGFGAVIVQTAGPAYAVEMSHPAYRGVLTGLFQSCFFLGTIVSTWVEYGLSYMINPSSFQWRFPMALQGLPSIIVLVFVAFIPETPRWYISRGQDDKARAILAKYHSGGNAESEMVNMEMDEMKEVISIEGSETVWWDYRSLFNSRGNIHRFALVAAIAFFGQWDLPPTSYYMPLMVQTAGITSQQTQLLLNAIQTPIMMISALSGLRFIEYFGRRPLLMFSSSGMAICVFIITACTANQAGHPAVGATGIAFLYVFLVVFAFAWTPCQSLYPVEVLAFAQRGKGLAALNLMSNLAGLLNTYLPPIAVANVGWRFYLFYGIWDAIGVCVIYLFFVETRGRNLEEMDAIFADRHPVRASLRKEVKEVVIEAEK